MYSQEDFREHYSQFELWCQDQGYEDVEDLQRSCTKRSVAEDLYFFRKIRNFVIHNPRAKERLSLTDAFKNDFEELCQRFMVNLNDIAIPVKEIFKREISDTLVPTIKIMKERVFTHTPVMMGRKVWGVFSENTLFELAENGEYSRFNESTRFMDIASFITTYDDTSVFDFIGRSATVENVKNIFSEAAKMGRKLDVLFITTTGKKDGDLVGMITIWDITTI